MEYVIANSNKSIFIKLDSVGRPVTCVKHVAQKFSDKKARNILASLPKTLRKFQFEIVPIPDEKSNENNSVIIKETTVTEPKCEVDCSSCRRTIKNEDYTISNEITGWIERIELCNNLIVDAISRKNELFEQLSNVDRELSNCLHEIELTKNKNACDGYKEYKKVKMVLEKRRIIKDELSVVQSISSCDVNFSQIESLVDKLKNREFVFREVDYTI